MTERNIEIQGKWVDAVIEATVRVCPDDPHVHLTVLARAYALGCKIIGCDKATAIANFDKLFDTEILPQDRMTKQ